MTRDRYEIPQGPKQKRKITVQDVCEVRCVVCGNNAQDLREIKGFPQDDIDRLVYTGKTPYKDDTETPLGICSDCIKTIVANQPRTYKSIYKDPDFMLRHREAYTYPIDYDKDYVVQPGQVSDIDTYVGFRIDPTTPLGPMGEFSNKMLNELNVFFSKYRFNFAAETMALFIHYACIEEVDDPELSYSSYRTRVAQTMQAFEPFYEDLMRKRVEEGEAAFFNEVQGLLNKHREKLNNGNDMFGYNMSMSNEKKYLKIIDALVSKYGYDYSVKLGLDLGRPTKESIKDSTPAPEVDHNLPSEDELEAFTKQLKEKMFQKNATVNGQEKVTNINVARSDSNFDYDMTPREIKEQLDEYIIDQDSAKESLSIAAHNHYKRLMNPETPLVKSNVLLIGPTGTGKTALTRRLSKIISVPFTEVDANSLTVAGYVGRDIESICYSLYMAAGQNLEMAQKGIVFIDEFDKLKADDKGSNVSSMGVQQALLKMIEGGTFDMPLNGNTKQPGKTVEFDTSNVLFIMGGAFVGLDELIMGSDSKANAKIAGFTAPLQPENKEDAQEQSMDLTSGHLKDYGIIPEIIGRIGIVARLNALTKEALKRILTDVKESVTTRYINSFKLDGIDLDFSEEALDRIADIAVHHEEGARSLQTVVEKSLHKHQFELPGSDVTKFTVEEKHICEDFS